MILCCCYNFPLFYVRSELTSRIVRLSLSQDEPQGKGNEEDDDNDDDFDATATLMDDPNTLLDDSDVDEDENGSADATPTKAPVIRSAKASADDDAEEVTEEDLARSKRRWHGVPGASK